MSSAASWLLESDLFKPIPEHLTNDERINISYHRAGAVAKAYGLETTDILNLTPKFWQIHQDMLLSVDFAAFILVSTQYNVAGATLAAFVADQPEYQPLLDRVLRFDVSFATPNSPRKGFPRVALVFARLLVSTNDWGVKPFVVWLNDGKQMRAGSKPLDHTITAFTHVRLPRSALLGPLKKPGNVRENFLSMIQRASVGALAFTTALIPAMKRAVFIAGKYSLRRQILGQNNTPLPIISFRTQQLPILHALAQIAVFEAYAHDSIEQFRGSSSTPAVQRGISATFKAVLCQASQPMFHALSERCGAQGLWKYNHIIESQLETRAVSIMEGDTLALSIRLGIELLLNRYELPPPVNPGCLLARHEKGLFDECRSMLEGLKEGHRSAEFNSLILPRCPVLAEAIGHRRAYEAAVKAGIDSDLLALYEIHTVLLDPSWYTQHTDLTREYLFRTEARLLDALLPQLDKLLDETGAGPYCTAPILSQASWDAFVGGLETLDGVGMSKDRARL
ncbi:hypothetical protein ETB97_002594 [Aspergillus alliaceus]|uniref:Acyl-CoA oxidase C-alpha1 domain-containing protein n=1 Tax=Petromyces alliaceus TaxID=209559 RepID=A0A8H6E4Y1_PETAA|nr:hypothetical protein ETB97_002594 [Aspergillus burnettii]